MNKISIKIVLIIQFLMILFLFGCSEASKVSEWHPKQYVNIELPEVWAKLLDEEQIADIQFKFFKDISEFYLPVVVFTAEMENSINDIAKILSDKNLDVLFSQLQLIPEMYYHFESFNVDSPYPFFSNFSNKEINARYMLTFKLYVLAIYYAKNEEKMNNIETWFSQNFNRMPAEFQVANYLSKYQQICQRKYSLQLDFLLGEEQSKTYKFNFNFSTLPTKLKDVEQLCWTPIGDIFALERHNFYHNYLLTYYFREVLKVANATYFNATERTQFINRYENKSKLFNALQGRILFQRLRFKYSSVQNKEEIKIPEYPEIRFLNLLYENVEENLNIEKMLEYFFAWEDFCYKQIDLQFK